MSIKVKSQVMQTQVRRNLFSKLQGLAFSNFMASSFTPMQEREGHLDLESQEIFALLKSNIEKLGDASSRMEFMMGELSQIMKKGI